MKNVADRLAIFVAKNGRQLEHLTRQKNPGDTPFKYVSFVFVFVSFLCMIVVPSNSFSVGRYLTLNWRKNT